MALNFQIRRLLKPENAIYFCLQDFPVFLLVLGILFFDTTQDSDNKSFD